MDKGIVKNYNLIKEVQVRQESLTPAILFLSGLKTDLTYHFS